ncbi:SiaB family protein kinase [Bacillus sp. FJAT-45350]|uniref:SiaB family protein kinase n=1 Tax=Bacillus sp. FJAT-45350 TaxID=2011014 RepID=UPI001C541718|nr:SiaB family protein kinase [Bacillus sp. FJAT-45350]
MNHYKLEGAFNLSISHLLNLQNLLRDEGVLISFSGRFSQSIIEELGAALKKYLEEENKPKNNIYNIFAIFIEQTQNIKNYCTLNQNHPNYEKFAQSCIVTIGIENETNYIHSGNLILNKDVNNLVEKVEALQKLNKDDLKKLFKEKRKESLILEEGSAGLGLIEIARKASSPLNYSITRIDDQFSFFTLKVLV